MNKIYPIINGKILEKFNQKRIPKTHLILIGLISGLFGVYVIMNSFAAENQETLYVDKDSIGGTCSDSRAVNEVTQSTPWCTLNKAASSAPGGSTVIIREGTYPALDINNNVSRTSYTTLQSYSGETVTADIDISNSQYIRLEGLKLIGDVGLLRSNHIELVSNEITPDGVMVRGSTDLLLENNDIHDIRRDTAGCPAAPSLGNGYAIWLNASSDIRSERVTIKNNRIHNVTHDAIQTGSTDDLLIEGNDVSNVKAVDCGDHSDVLQIVEGRRITVRANHFHDSAHGFIVNGHGTTFRGDLRFENNLIEGITGSFGMNLYNTDGLVIVNNTVWDTLLGVRLRDTTENPTVMHATIKNNVFDQYGSECDSIGCIDYQDYNLIASGERHGAHDLSGNPAFVNAGAADYHMAAGSTGIDAGTSEGAPNTDKDGNGRTDISNVPNAGGGSLPYYDIGAYEYQAGGSTPPDTTFPSISLTSPANNSSVSGNVTVSANASDNVGVAGVQFKLDGNNLGGEDTSPPYSITWDTAIASNASHVLTAVVRDAAGNTATADDVIVTVNNASQFSCSGSTAFICEDFDDGAAAFTPSAATWSVVSGKYKLTNPTSGGNVGLFNRSLHNSPVSIDFDLTVDASVDDGSTDFDDFGVIFNYQDADNYYYASFNESNDGATNGLFRVQNGSQTEIADFSSTISANTTYDIKIEKTGPTIKAYLNDVSQAIAEDSTFTGGMVGVGSRNDSATFDNVVVVEREPDTPPVTDTTDPTISFSSPANNDTVSGIVTSAVNASDDIGVDRVEFSLDDSLKLTDSSAPYNYSFDSKTLSNGSHTITATAYDAAGNTETATITVNVNNPDITPPNAPANLSATATNPTTVNLSWNTSTDPGSSSTGVTKYNVLRNGTVIAQVDAPATSYTDNDLAANTNYSYVIQAVDGAGNTSTNSNDANVTTPEVPDETAPSVPGNLQAVAANHSQINLSWDASTDEGGSGLAGYNVYRGNTKLNNNLVTGTSYGDSTVTANSSYNYRVEAVDGAGNKSAKTNAVSADTPSTPVKLGDVTGPSGQPDGQIDLRDISYLIRKFNTSDPAADVTGLSGTSDGIVDLRDISYLIRNYGN
jgi:Bacterial Ig domain/Right handed beta helix region/Fibronectin type III domain